jgi:hypothetical protein
MEMITDNNVNLNNYQDTNNLEMEMNFSNVGWADGEYVIYRDKHAKDVHVQISASWMEKIKKLNHDEQSMNQGTEEVIFTMFVKLHDDTKQNDNPIINAQIMTDSGRRTDSAMIKADRSNIPSNRLAFKRKCDESEPELITLQQNGKKSFQLSSKYKSNSKQRGQKQFLTLVIVCVPIINQISMTNLAIRSPLFTVRSKKTEDQNPEAKTRVKGKEIEAEEEVEKSTHELCYAIEKKKKEKEEMDQLFEKLSFIERSIRFSPNTNRLDRNTIKKIDQVYAGMVEMMNSKYKMGWQDKESSSSSLSLSSNHCKDQDEETNQPSAKRSRTSNEGVMMINDAQLTAGVQASFNMNGGRPFDSSSSSHVRSMSSDEMGDDTDENVVDSLVSQYLGTSSSSSYVRSMSSDEMEDDTDENVVDSLVSQYLGTSSSSSSSSSHVRSMSSDEMEDDTDEKAVDSLVSQYL